MAHVEMRTDLWTGRQAIVAGDRANRPQGVSRSPGMSDSSAEIAADPFLEGREGNTPEEVLALRKSDSSPDTAGWLVRIVSNRYPAVCPLTDQTPNAVRGLHDVVIECPDFRRGWDRFSVAEVTRVLQSWQLRQSQILAIEAIHSIQIFRNQGAFAGASLGHSHSQMIALTTVPELVERRVERANRFADWRQAELDSQIRVIEHSHGLLAVCPHTATVAGQIRICPDNRLAEAPFHELSTSQLTQLAIVLRKCFTAVEQMFPSTGFNLVVNQPDTQRLDVFPWSIDVMPRASSFAGFELACDIPIITIPPERAAARYRESWPSADADIDECAPGEELIPPGYSWFGC